MTTIGLTPALVGAVVLLIGGLVAARYRDSLTWYHVPAVVLLLLGLTVAGTAAAAAQSINQESQEIDYEVDRCESETDAGPTTMTPGTEYLEFESLSPAAQQVFEKTLENGGEYTATRSPDDFRYSSDTWETNYVRYDSQCYTLVADSVGPGGGLAVFFIFVIGSVITFLLTGAGVVSLWARQFKFPVAVLGGLGAVVVLLAADAWLDIDSVLLGFDEVTATFAVTFVGTWIATKWVEIRSSRSFRERMRTDGAS